MYESAGEIKLALLVPVRLRKELKMLTELNLSESWQNFVQNLSKTTMLYEFNRLEWTLLLGFISSSQEVGI